MNNFSQYLSFESFMKMVEANASLPHRDDPTFRTQCDLMHEVVAQNLQKALGEFLKDKHAAGELSPIPNSEGHRTNFMNLWNKKVASDSKDAEDTYETWEIVAQDLSSNLFSYISHWGALSEKTGKPFEKRQKGYQQLLSIVNSGTMEHIRLREQYCFETGITYNLHIKNWQPELFTYEYSNHKRIDTPMAPLFRNKVEHTEINFPSGELLIANWFHLDAFIALAKDDWKFDINCSLGALESVKHHIEKDQYICIPVGNSSPKLFAQNGLIFCGDDQLENDDEKYNHKAVKAERKATNLKKIGCVSTQLWAVTIIDKARLVEIVATTVGEGEARKQVEAHIKKQGRELTQHTVKPGIHHIYYSGRKHEFIKDFSSPEVSTPAFSPYFVIADHELTMNVKAKPKTP